MTDRLSAPQWDELAEAMAEAGHEYDRITRAFRRRGDEAARRERDWPKDFQGWRTMHSAPKDGSWFQGLTTHDNVVACQFIAEDTEEGDTHGSNEFGLPGGVRFMLKAWQPLARPSQEAARREAEPAAPPPPAPFVTDHKWLDPECHASGCQTLILKAEIQKLRDQRDKYMWQVRDTCARAEAAEAREKRLREALELVLPLAKSHVAKHDYESSRTYLAIAESALAQGGTDGGK